MFNRKHTNKNIMLDIPLNKLLKYKNTNSIRNSYFGIKYDKKNTLAYILNKKKIKKSYFIIDKEKIDNKIKDSFIYNLNYISKNIKESASRKYLKKYTTKKNYSESIIINNNSKNGLAYNTYKEKYSKSIKSLSRIIKLKRNNVLNNINMII